MAKVFCFVAAFPVCCFACSMSAYNKLAAPKAKASARQLPFVRPSAPPSIPPDTASSVTAGGIRPIGAKARPQQPVRSALNQAHFGFPAVDPRAQQRAHPVLQHANTLRAGDLDSAEEFLCFARGHAAHREASNQRRWFDTLVERSDNPYAMSTTELENADREWDDVVGLDDVDVGHARGATSTSEDVNLDFAKVEAPGDHSPPSGAAGDQSPRSQQTEIVDPAEVGELSPQLDEWPSVSPVSEPPVLPVVTPALRASVDPEVTPPPIEGRRSKSSSTPPMDGTLTPSGPESMFLFDPAELSDADEVKRLGANNENKRLADAENKRLKTTQRPTAVSWLGFEVFIDDALGLIPDAAPAGAYVNPEDEIAMDDALNNPDDGTLPDAAPAGAALDGEAETDAMETALRDPNVNVRSIAEQGVIDELVDKVAMGKNWVDHLDLTLPSGWCLPRDKANDYPCVCGHPHTFINDSSKA